VGLRARRLSADNLLPEGATGLVLTGLMVLLFLGSMRATAAVFLSIPLSALAAFMAISAGGGSVNTMVLGGLALAISRLIDNSVVVLQNIFRHVIRGSVKVILEDQKRGEVVAFKNLHGHEVKLRNLLEPSKRLGTVEIGDCSDALAHHFNAVRIHLENDIDYGGIGVPDYRKTNWAREDSLDRHPTLRKEQWTLPAPAARCRAYQQTKQIAENQAMGRGRDDLGR
jgi:hypothetical protein